MNRILLVLGVIVLIAVLVVGTFAGAYNRLLGLATDVDRQWAQVENQLQRRLDLIPNLVETVKGVAGQEQKVFGDIADARAKLAGGGLTPAQRAAAESELSGALSRLLVVVENYPQLRSVEAFRQLMDELAGTENRIATERQRYNDAVARYNLQIRRFPTVFYARLLGFGEREYFKAAGKDVPKVDFNIGR